MVCRILHSYANYRKAAPSINARPDLARMILPGTTVTVKNPHSIYRGYVGFVQRISGDRAAVLFDNYSPWEKMITFPISDLVEGGRGPK